MDNRIKALKNLLYNTLNLAVTIGFGLLLPHLFTVGYGSEVNGLLTSLNNLIACLNLFEAGVGAAALQALYKPVALDDWDGINGVMAAADRYYKRTGLWYFISLLAVSACYPLVVNSSLSFFTVAGSVFFSGIGNVVVFFLQGKYRFLLEAQGKGYITANLSTLTYVLVSMTKVFLIYRNASVVLILAAAFFIQCIPAAYILWYVRRYSQLHLDVQPDYHALAQKDSALIHQISWLVFSNTDALILSVACGLRTASVYSMFKLVASHLESLLDVLLNSLKFSLGQTYQTDKKRFIQRIDLLESGYSVMLYSFFSVALFLYLPFMRLYTAGVTDANYTDPYLALLFVLISLMSKSREVMGRVIHIAGHFKQTLPHTILETAVNLTTSLAGVYYLGIYGVLLGTAAALLYRGNQMILYSNHKLLERSAKTTYAIHGVNFVLFCLIQPLYHRLFDPAALNTYPRLAAAGFVTTFLSLSLFAAVQTALFPHCRTAVRVLFQRLRGTGGASA